MYVKDFLKKEDNKVKIKNSYILLIGIAIFLLISIGSVCASENITDNNDVPLADDGADVVLSNTSDTGENVPDDTPTEKINTTVETDKDTYKFHQDSDKNLTVKVKDSNKTNVYVDVNKTDLKISEGNKTINFEYNNTIITIKEVLSVGSHNLTIEYLGNDNYINSTRLIKLEIYGNNTLETETTVYSKDGKHIEIPFTITNGLENITELIADNFNLTLVYTNETGKVCNLTIPKGNYTIDNGKIIYDSPFKLIAASVIVKYVNATVPKTVNIKISTEVKVVKDEYKFKSEENKTISITISADKENLNINKTDLKVLDNGKEIKDFKYENSNLTLNLGVGVHNLTIIYNGNATYAANSTTTIVKVSGNQTIDPQKTANIDKEGKVNITLNLSDGADPVNVNLDNLTVTLFWKVGNQTPNNKTIAKDKISLASDKQTISFTVDESFESAYVDINYEAENNLTGKTTIKVGTNITAPDTMQYGVGETISFPVEIKSVNGTALNVSSVNIKIFNNGKEVKFTCNNSVITLTDNFTYGVYNLTINYLGTDTYSDSTKVIALTVYGINATASTNINSTKKGEVKVEIINGADKVNITKDDLKVTVTYKDGNNTKNITATIDKYENGTLYFTLENGNFTTATMTITYNNTETNVTLNRIYNFNVIPIKVDTDFQEGNFTFQIVDIDDGNKPLVNKTVTLSGKNSAGTQLTWIIISGTNTYSLNTNINLKTDENGIITLVNKGFYPGYTFGENVYSPAGDYTVTIAGTGNLKGSNTTNITINKIDLKISIEKFNEYYGTSKKFTIIVTNAKSGNPIYGVTVNFDVTKDGKDKITYQTTSDGKTTAITSSTTNSEGKIELPASNLMSGTYTIKGDVSNTTNYNAAKGSGDAIIKKIPTTINAKDVTVQYNTGATSTITVKDKNGKAVSGMYLLVRLYTTSSKYNDYLFQTNSKGQVSFSASLAVGKHKMIVTSADNRYEAKQVTKTITVKKASATIKAPKVTDYYKGVKSFAVKLVNSKNKKAIYDAKLNIKIFVSKNRYYNYKGNTGMNGQIKLLLDTLKPGNYKVVVSGADSKNFNAKQVTSKIVIKKAPAKLVPKKLTAKKGAKKYFQVTVKNKKTKKVITGVKIKVKVYTGKKAKTYTLKTNTKGIAKLNVNKLKVGTHKVVVTSANKYVTAKQAKSTIKIKR